jgi:hypothetical protein
MVFCLHQEISTLYKFNNPILAAQILYLYELQVLEFGKNYNKLAQLLLWAAITLLQRDKKITPQFICRGCKESLTEEKETCFQGM